MHRYQPRIRLVATGLSFAAGFVDATGFMKLNGFFVSFMSGNTTRLGVGIGTFSDAAVTAGGLIIAFVAGVMLGTLLARTAVSIREAAVLSFVSVLLAVAALLGWYGFVTLSAGAMALAMGAENAVFAREGDVHIGLTYMTGTLVKIGQRLTEAFYGGDALGFLPYLQLWLGLTLGAVAGTTLYDVWDIKCLLLASATFAAFAMIALRFDFGPTGKQVDDD